MPKRRRSTGIVKKASRRLARKQTGKLWGALTDFVNLRPGVDRNDSGESGLPPLVRLSAIQPADVRRFRRKQPDFFPRECYDIAEGRVTWPGLGVFVSRSDPGISIVRDRVGTQFFQMYRRWLRALWWGKKIKEGSYGARLRMENERVLEILLGLWPDHLAGLPGGRESWLPPARIFPILRTGRFGYEASCEFQWAVYYLFRERWRAKVCGRCRRCFVADKQRQIYCGVECSALAEKLRKLAWWHRSGKDWRAARAAHEKRPSGGKRVLTKSHRKGGK
jgi:hypothetical protein